MNYCSSTYAQNIALKNIGYTTKIIYWYRYRLCYILPISVYYQHSIDSWRFFSTVARLGFTNKVISNESSDTFGYCWKKIAHLRHRHFWRLQPLRQIERGSFNLSLVWKSDRQTSCFFCNSLLNLPENYSKNPLYRTRTEIGSYVSDKSRNEHRIVGLGILLSDMNRIERHIYCRSLFFFVYWIF